MRAPREDRRSGFTLIEVMITIVIMFVVMDAVMLFFLNVIGEFRRQSKIAETGVETVIGLEVLRKDIESAGYGLPWSFLPGYTEGAAVLADASDDGNPPRAIINLVGAGLYGSDILVIKSVSVGTDAACGRWTTLQAGDIKRTWGDNALSFAGTDEVLVLGTGADPTVQRRYIGMTTYAGTSDAAFQPASPAVNLIHGLTDGAVPRMPFNRAEYFIDNTNVPALCAPGTGVLVKSVIVNSTGPGGGTRGPLLPLLDCVRDFRVAFGINMLGNAPEVDNVAGAADNAAALIRTRLRDVRVSILAHEGARDDRYKHPESSIFVGDNTFAPVGAPKDMSGLLNYRWKVHTLLIRPSSLR
ncbi:MAG TPA: prepilin-type N-terminal cleavage/methylation domain-containing protein [Candidatus Deferrimicrobiaceae bacterium]|jgi:prepilin-type N-terminal cleavage/methylation domain-containing protein